MIIKTTIETIETTGFAVKQVAYCHKVVSIVSIVVKKLFKINFINMNNLFITFHPCVDSRYCNLKHFCYLGS